MRDHLTRLIRLESVVAAAAPPPEPEPEPDPIERMSWRIFDRARQGRLHATGATGALDWRRESSRTGPSTPARLEACARWDGEVHDEGERLEALGPDAWRAELRGLGVAIDGILESEWNLLPPDARPRPQMGQTG